MLLITPGKFQICAIIKIFTSFYRAIINLMSFLDAAFHFQSQRQKENEELSDLRSRTYEYQGDDEWMLASFDVSAISMHLIINKFVKSKSR